MSYHFADLFNIFSFFFYKFEENKYLQTSQKKMDKQISGEVVVRTYIFIPLHIIQIAGGIPSGGNGFYTTDYKITKECHCDQYVNKQTMESQIMKI